MPSHAFVVHYKLYQVLIFDIFYLHKEIHKKTYVKITTKIFGMSPFLLHFIWTTKV